MSSTVTAEHPLHADKAHSVTKPLYSLCTCNSFTFKHETPATLDCGISQVCWGMHCWPWLKVLKNAETCSSFAANQCNCFLNKQSFWRQDEPLSSVVLYSFVCDLVSKPRLPVSILVSCPMLVNISSGGGTQDVQCASIAYQQRIVKILKYTIAKPTALMLWNWTWRMSMGADKRTGQRWNLGIADLLFLGGWHWSEEDKHA